LDLYLTDKLKDSPNTQIFGDEAILEAQEFTHLHRIVLQLRPLNLEEQFERRIFQDVNVTDINRRTPLLWASWTNRLSDVESLLLRQADVDLTDLEGETALSKACGAGNADCVERLLQAGASATIGNRYSVQPIHRVSQQSRNGVRILRALAKYGADVNARTKSLSTPLHFAASAGLSDNIEWLIYHGADVSARDVDGLDAAHIALSNWHDNLFCSLVERGIDLSGHLRDGTCVLHTAAWCGSKESWVAIERAAREGRMYGIDFDAQHDGHDIITCYTECRKIRSHGRKLDNNQSVSEFRRLFESIRKFPNKIES